MANNDTTRTVSFFIQLNTSAIDRDAPLDIWCGILDLDANSEWLDVYQAIGLAYLTGGDYSEYVLDSDDNVTTDKN